MRLLAQVCWALRLSACDVMIRYVGWRYEAMHFC